MTAAGDHPIGMTRSAWEVTELTDRAETLSRDPNAAPDTVAEAWQAVLDHPCSAHQVDRAEVFDALHQALRRDGRHVEAIGAKRAAINAGYRSRPDPEADIAEILIDAGRHGEATLLYEVLRDRDPDEVWLYNSAALSWTGVDDPVALEWACCRHRRGHRHRRPRPGHRPARRLHPHDLGPARPGTRPGTRGPGPPLRGRRRWPGPGVRCGGRRDGTTGAGANPA